MSRCISRYYITYGLLTVGTIIFLFLQLEQVEKIQEQKNAATIDKHVVETKPKLEEPNEDNFTRVMKERRRVMRAACEKEGLDREAEDDLHKVKPWEYLINRKYSLVWCNVFKSASSSWMYIFNVLSGYSVEFLEKSRAVPLQLARNKYPRPSERELTTSLALSNVTSIIVGRSAEFDFFPKSDLCFNTEILLRDSSRRTGTRSTVPCLGLSMTG